ncbi:heterokaryon incompatibility protein-domain-containing protein [Xylaria scruposa]|nr:heterokaryon incompatibility protein-domain-containing protein [Xylaria scruposa]
MPVLNIKLERPPFPQGKTLKEIVKDPSRCLSCFNLYAGTAWSRTSGPIYGLNVSTTYEVHRYAAERLGISPEIPSWITGSPRLDYAAWEVRTPLRDIQETSQAGCSSCTLIKQAVTSLCPDLVSAEDPNLVAYLSFCTGRILWIHVYREELAQGSGEEDDDEVYGFGQPFEQVSNQELLVELEIYVLQGQKSLWPTIGCSMPYREKTDGGVFADKIGGVAKHIVQNPESRPGLRRIRAWIDNCLANHKSCREAASKAGPFLPKRVIHVGPGDNTTIYLVEPAEDLEASYIALSHRWGKSTPPKLTKDTLSRRKQNMPWSQLTKTFQDAILVTRGLGIQYIWIDSLCIVQDDAADWAAEAAKMASIYESALLVISATASSDGDEGCLLQRTPYTEIRITAADSNELFTVFARKTLPHNGFLA